MFSVDGLVSGLDTTSIIEGALAVQQNRIDRLNVRKQELADEQTVFKSIEGSLLGLQGGLRRILRSSNNAFDTKVASSSDEEALGASASSSAATGTYRLQVTQLAQAHQLKTDGFSSRSELINTGTLKIQVGQRAETSILIDDSNNSLEGLAAAINSQVRDVRAAVIDDGTGTDQSFRLLLTSRHTGSENQITIANSLGARRERGSGAGETRKPEFDANAVQEAKDATVQIGNGLGALTINSSENQFDDLIPGVTLDALRAELDKEVVITISEDTEEVVSAISDFVDAYNDVIEVIDSNSKFDPDSETAGLLLGNRSAANVQSTLRGALSTVVQGVNDNLKTLTSVGISTNSQGKLNLDQTKLQDILNGRVEGVGLDDIRRLFAIDGQSDNPGVEFLLATNKTKASVRDPESGLLLPYEVEINRAAAQAVVQSEASLLDDVVINADNDVFDFKIDNIQLTLKLPHATYTPIALADQLQTLINTSPDRAGRQGLVEIVGDVLSVKSASYGKSSIIEILSGTANAALGLASGQTSVGTDVAGVFRVQLPGQSERITEQATGNGRTLSGKTENEYTAQLQVRSTLQANQIASETDAHLTVTRGIGAALDAAISELLDSDGGELSATQDGLNRQIESLDENVERVEAQLEARRESMLREFAALESTLAELQSVGSALSSSLLTL